MELTTNRNGVQPVGSPDIILVGFEHESSRVSFGIFVELARSDSGDWRDRTDSSSRILPSQIEHNELLIVFRMPILRYRFQDYVSIVQVDPSSDDYNDERDGADWSSRMSFGRVKHG